MSARQSLVAGLRVMSGLAQEGLRQAETRALHLLRRRMELAEVAPEPAGSTAPVVRPAAGDSPAVILRGLLEQSMEQSRDESRSALFVRLVRSLLPDEARILAALSDGSTYPLIHVEAGPRLGAATRRVLANLSTVGKSAGVVWSEMTPAYIGHLFQLGLVEAGPEDDAHEVKYEILAADELTRAAVERIRKTDRQKETIVRRALRISELGRALWAACEMDGT